MRRTCNRIWLRGIQWSRNTQAVVIPVMTQHYAMLQRNLLYTGVTRGKRLVVLVGQKKAVAHRGAQRLGPTALVEAGGMAERGRSLSVT